LQPAQEKIAGCTLHNTKPMLIKKDRLLKFSKKRNGTIISPCCGKRNIDGKFVNYEGYPLTYGYCHSCGIATTPPAVYSDENGEEYQWNETTSSWEQGVVSSTTLPLSENVNQEINHPEHKFIPKDIIWKYFQIEPENNLLKYLRNNFPQELVDTVKETYAIGTTKDGGTIFWLTNQNSRVQKAKISYYNSEGKRTNKFKVPYKNKDGYFACLFGAHLLSESYKGSRTVVLVESEKTAIVGEILLPQYVWLAYGGINGLTDDKIDCLIGHKVLIIPDISENAVSIAYKKLPLLHSKKINARIWDMTEGKTDLQLKEEEIYNNDLEDLFRQLY